jgi:hypothetical protein
MFLLLFLPILHHLIVILPLLSSLRTLSVHVAPYGDQKSVYCDVTKINVTRDPHSSAFRALKGETEMGGICSMRMRNIRHFKGKDYIKDL